MIIRNGNPESPTQINRNIGMPLHQQIYSMAREKIRSGEWKEGQMIPSEPELMNQYGVSRIVIRQVLNRLVSEGLIYRQQGRGSYVAERRLEEGLTRIISFTEDMLQRGFSPKTQVLESGILPAPDYIALQLGIEKGSELVYLSRLRIANDEPMSIEESYLVHRMVPNVLDEDYSHVPLRKILLNNYGVKIIRAKQVIRAIQATSLQAEWLTIPQKLPLLFIERVSFSDQDIPIEYLKIFFRSDRYSLFNELHD